nr:hypothetical protein [Tanacetum cinerariifolium]
MVAYLNKSDASEGFNQVIDFLNGSYIQLQALVDRKKVIITETAIRDALRLDDADEVDCLSNEEICAELARMGYEKPSTKLTFYKAFFSSQWKVGKGFLGVETPLFEGMLVVGEIEEQGDAEEQDNVDDAAQEAATDISGDDVQDQSIPSPTPPTPSLQQPQDLPSTSQVQSSPPQPQSPPPAQPQEHDKVAQDIDITKLKTRLKKLERANKVKALKLRRLKKVGTSQRIESSADSDMEDASNQRRMIADLDRDTESQAEIYQIDMDHASKVLSMQEDEPEVQEVVDIVTSAKLITEVVTAASESITTASTTISAAEPQVLAAAITTTAPVIVSKDKGKGIMVEESKPMKKKQQVEMDEEYARKLHEELNKDIDWSVAIDHVKKKAKEDSYVQRYQSKEQIEEEENRAIESINETPAQKAAKRRKLNEEVEDLKQHLEIVPDEDNDVYTEATPLARKVPVEDYQIILLNNKLHYKIIRADGTHQLYVSFITLLKNFDREYLESLWSIVKERFSTSKPNNFSDDYLLTTLRGMFGRPDGQDQVWKSQRSVHGQAKLILLVERRYPLSRFTLDQMLNAVRLRVEEQSEMSLKLIRFTRQQLQEGHHE